MHRLESTLTKSSALTDLVMSHAVYKLTLRQVFAIRYVDVSLGGTILILFFHLDSKSSVGWPVPSRYLYNIWTGSRKQLGKRM
jgi:hypothetical protein